MRQMKRMAWLLLAVLASGILAHAADTKKDEAKQMTGWLCNSKCVKPIAGKNTCDKTCTSTEGPVVFIDSKGSLLNISNQDMVMSHAGKKCKVMCMRKDKNTIQVQSVQEVPEYAGP